MDARAALNVDTDSGQGVVLLSSTAGSERRVVGLTPDDALQLCALLAEKALALDPGALDRVQKAATIAAAHKAGHNEMVRAVVRSRLAVRARHGH